MSKKLICYYLDAGWNTEECYQLYER